MPAPERVPPRRVTGGEAADLRATLIHGELTVRGRIRNASNAVLFGEVEYEGTSVPCVYKPVAGERPLWDFPEGSLAAREVAAYEVSRATGWQLVPTTVLRDGPLGEGMCQEWVGALPGDETPGVAAPSSSPRVIARNASAPADGEPGEAVDGISQADEADDPTALFALVEGDEPGPGWKTVGHAETEDGHPALFVHADDARLRRLAVLDAVINNADRKGGHLLITGDGRLKAIDHGVTFHAEDKLRTLLWGWAGEPLTGEAVAALRLLESRLVEGAQLAERLSALITPAETDAVRERVSTLLATGCHPLPGGGWPPFPWPPL